MIAGQIISGEFGSLIIRQKSGRNLEIGEILVAETRKEKILLQVFDLVYGSQIPQHNLELISGMKLEEESTLEFIEPEIKNYTLAKLKNLATIKNGRVMLSKTLPDFFIDVRELAEEDLDFLTKPKTSMLVGKLRSGSKIFDFDVFLDGEEVLTHHVLIAATTGRGKSNLTSCMLWDCADKDYCGILVLDPHDEYYGRNKFGLKDNPSSNIIYYTPKKVPPGCRTLKISLKNIRPWHFKGIIDWSDPQNEALQAFYKKHGEDWIKRIMLDKELENFQEGTLNVLRRRMASILDIKESGSSLECSGVFDEHLGQTTLKDIVYELENAKIVVIDTSSFTGATELLIGSMLAHEIFNRYKRYKSTGELGTKPVISIVLEEAPRVLSADAIEKGNIFSTIAREGRKFKVGLIAITQLPSLIPRQILANINTKIILGIEMRPERQAIIDSASQDMSADERNIASLDKGEAIITSNSIKFATPIKIPLLSELAAKRLAELKIEREKEKFEMGFEGIGLDY